MTVCIGTVDHDKLCVCAASDLEHGDDGGGVEQERGPGGRTGLETPACLHPPAGRHRQVTPR